MVSSEATLVAAAARVTSDSARERRREVVDVLAAAAPPLRRAGARFAIGVANAQPCAAVGPRERRCGGAQELAATDMVDMRADMADVRRAI